MRKKWVMIIGPTGCGKTTLARTLNDSNEPVRRTQDIIYQKNTMDVPGAYLENAWMYKHLIAASQDAFCILLMIDQSKAMQVYAPGFAKAFHCPVIGIISKADLLPENQELCIRQLKSIGVKEPYYKISISDQNKVKELKDYIFGSNASWES